MKGFERANRGSGGFTLIELMVAVALIGILSATAISGFRLYQLRSKRSEALVNLGSMRKAQLAYFHEYGGFVIANPTPGLPGYPAADKQLWQVALGGTFDNGPPIGGFNILGWTPEGATFFDYDTNAPPGAGAFTSAAYGDTDGDGAVSVFLYVHPDAAGVAQPNLTGPPFFNFPFDPVSCQPILDTVAQVPANGACGLPVADDF